MPGAAWGGGSRLFPLPSGSLCRDACRAGSLGCRAAALALQACREQPGTGLFGKASSWQWGQLPAAGPELSAPAPPARGDVWGGLVILKSLFHANTDNVSARHCLSAHQHVPCVTAPAQTEERG